MKKFCPFILIVPTFILFFQCTEDKPLCTCTIPVVAEEEFIKGSEKKHIEQAVTIDPKIKAQIRREIEAEVSAGLKYSNIYEQVNETYKKLRNTNPEANNAYQWYRAIACAYFEVICLDETLTGAERRKEQYKVIDNFKVNFEKVLLLPKGSGPPKPYTEKPKPCSGSNFDECTGIWICSSKGIPKGCIVNDIQTCSKCECESQWFIKNISEMPIGSEGWICEFSTIPDGWKRLLETKKTCNCCPSTLPNGEGPTYHTGSQIRIKKFK